MELEDIAKIKSKVLFIYFLFVLLLKIVIATISKGCLVSI